MEYKELAKLYYMDSSNSRDSNHEVEHRRRLMADSTFRLGFETPQGELFIAMPRELSTLMESVLRTEATISTLLNSLSPIAAGAVLRGLVLDEVVSTNAIEDIYSTRRQVKEALEASASAAGDPKRFRELAMLYLKMADGNAELPSSVEDIRSVYDQVTMGEIPKDKLPDGRLFRVQGVDIVQGGARVVHSGLEPEEKIIEALLKMIKLPQDIDMPSLCSALASHYLFEYIHPFYDGNGRTGRYLLSLYLSKSLSPATALSLSRVIAENRPSYYKAFTTVEKALNRAELTFFVYSMLELVQEAQAQLKARLGKSDELISMIGQFVERASTMESFKEQEVQIVSMLSQYCAFGLINDVPLHAIASHLDLKEQMTRKHLASLERKGVVAKCRKRNPITFALTEEVKEKYGFIR